MFKTFLINLKEAKIAHLVLLFLFSVLFLSAIYSHRNLPLADQSMRSLASATTSATTTEDMTPPQLTLNEPVQMYIMLDDVFVDPGAFAYDEYDGDLSAYIFVDGEVDVSTVGMYILTYTVYDNAQNSAMDRRFVTVEYSATNLLPMIEVVGDDYIEIEQGEQYVEQGATAYDDEDGDITNDIQIVGSVDTSTSGTYDIAYKIQDSEGAVEYAHRVVMVREPEDEGYGEDSTATTTEQEPGGVGGIESSIPEDDHSPEIGLYGGEFIILYNGDEYIDEGASAYDEEDGDLTEEIKTVNPVDTSINDTYYVRYSVEDSNGNSVEVKRTVVVRERKDDMPPQATTTTYVTNKPLPDAEVAEVPGTTEGAHEENEVATSSDGYDSSHGDKFKKKTEGTNVSTSTQGYEAQPPKEYTKQADVTYIEPESSPKHDVKDRSTDEIEQSQRIPSEFYFELKEDRREALAGEEQVSKEVLIVLPQALSVTSVLHSSEEFERKYVEENKELAHAIEEIVEEIVLEEKKLFGKRDKLRFARDSDNDGVSDYDEVVIYRTNPFNERTHAGDLTDGEKILAGIDPSSAEEKPIVFEDPRVQEGSPVIEDFTIETLVVTETKPSRLLQENVVSKIKFEGTGLPDSYVTIYIFSTPIIVTVKTDSKGRWSYELDKEIEDGTHEIYVATVDNSGKILAKSNPIPFTKVANAAVLGSEIVTPVGQSFVRSNFVMIIIALSAVGIVVMILLVGSYREDRQEVELVQENVQQDI